MSSFLKRDILAMGDFSKDEILEVLNTATLMKKGALKRTLEGKIMASCFFEPSTRTRLSFESAMLRLGGKIIGFSESSSTSATKGESLSDSMRVVGSFADVIVMRHPLEGSAKGAALATTTPVINGGDGANEHPTQTFLDLFTILECQGKLEGLNVVCVGDLKFGRTVHSLVLALKHFGARLFFVSPPSLALPDRTLDYLRDAGVPFSCHREMEEVIGKADVLYMTRIQQERFGDISEYHAVKNSFRLTPEILKQGKETLKVLHPLPRVDEINQEVDAMPQAAYFAQAENGVFVRMALLSLILGDK